MFYPNSQVSFSQKSNVSHGSSPYVTIELNIAYDCLMFCSLLIQILLGHFIQALLSKTTAICPSAKEGTDLDEHECDQLWQEVLDLTHSSVVQMGL